MRLDIRRGELMVDMAVAKTEWIWNVTMSEKIKRGNPVSPKFRKKIYKSWVETGWVKEKGSIEQLSLFN